MTRISILTREEMTDEQRDVIDESVSAGKPHGGPFWAYIRNPDLMRNVQDSAACIAASSLTKREQQIATLTVARYWSAEYPWGVQSRNGLKVGLTEEEIDAINSQVQIPSDDKRELLAQQVANELLSNRALSEATYSAAEDVFTTEELVTLVARVGSFSMTCCTANAFDITPPGDAPSGVQG